MACWMVAQQVARVVQSPVPVPPVQTGCVQPAAVMQVPISVAHVVHSAVILEAHAVTHDWYVASHLQATEHWINAAQAPPKLPFW
jgi:hypothetical protein